MAIVIRELAARLSLEADNFNNGLKRAQREAKEFEKTIKPSMTLAKDLGLALSATGIVVAGSLFAMTKAAADYGDTINKASVQTGISTEQLSRLKFAADQTESSFAGVSNGLKFLSKNAAAAADGTKLQESAFRELGVAVTDANGSLRPMNSLLLDVADKFAAMSDGTEKAALAQRLFGKSGMEMIPILNLGSKGIAAMGDEADRLGLVLSAEAAKAGDDFNDAMTAVNASVLGLSNSVAQALLPALTSTANFIRDSVATITVFAKEHETLTKIIFGTALAIAGAGGLLLAVTAIGAASGPFWVGVAAVKAFGLSLSGLALAGGPILLTVAAIGGLVIALVKLKSEWDETQKAWAFARFAANETVGTYVRFAEIQKKVVTELTQEQQFAQRLAEERLKDSKDIDKQYEAYKKRIQDKIDLDKKLAEQAEAAWKKIREIVAESNARMRDSIDRQMTAAVETYTKGYETIQRIIAGNVANTVRAEQDAAAAASRALGVQADVWEKAQDKKIGVAQDRIDAIDEMNSAAGDRLQKQVNEDAQKWQAVWENAMGNVVSNFANAVTDMLFAGKSFAASMKELFKDLAKTIIQVLVTDAFTKVAKGISGLLLGTAGTGGLLGLGGSAAPALAGGFLPVFGGAGGAAAGAGAAGTGGGAMAAAGAFATNPITIAVAGAIVAGIAWSKSQAHHEAKTFTDTMQDPFANAQGTGVINNIVDAFNAAAAAGALTKTQATEARASVEELWDTFKKQTAEFAKGGSDEALVARQAMETLAPLMTQILTDMSSTISTLADDVAALSGIAQALADDLALTHGFIDQVVNAGKGASNLNTALASLEGIGSTQAIILDRLGSDIENFFHVLTLSGLPIPDLIQKYHDLAAVHEDVAVAAERVVRATPGGKTGSLISVDSAAEIREFLAALGVGGGSQQVVLNVDGRQMATAVIPHSYALSRNLGMKVSGTR